MKKNPLNTSLIILEKKIREYFLRIEIHNPWFIESPIESGKSVHFNQPVNLVLFGSYFHLTLLFPMLPIKKVHIWVLCTKVKSVLVKLFGFPERCISIIPRNELFPAINSERKFNGLKDGKVHLVYSGRLSLSKNIVLLLALFKELNQTFSSGEMRLKLLGNFDSYPYINDDQKEKSQYEKRVKELIKDLTLGPVVEIVSNLDENQWLKYIDHQNAIMINISSSPYEDFGVALAQGLQRGARAIVSDWGGHSDLNEQSSFKIPSQFIINDYYSMKLPYFVAENYAKRIAYYLKNNLMKEKRVEESIDTAAERVGGTAREYIDFAELSSLVRKDLMNLESDATSIIKGLSFFTRTRKGKILFEKNLRLLESSHCDNDLVVIVTDNFHKLEEVLYGVDLSLPVRIITSKYYSHAMVKWYIVHCKKCYLDKDSFYCSLFTEDILGVCDYEWI